MPARYFYGWVIVAASFIILTVAYGVQFSYGVFLPHIMADLEIDRVSATAPFSLYIFLYTILGFVSGPATDRYGPRVVVLVGAALFGIGYFLLTTATVEWQLFLFLSLIAGMGMSAIFVPVNATVVRWFLVRRGMALAISGTGINGALLLGPMLATGIIIWLGWRAGLMAMGLIGAALIAACAITLVRDPEIRNLSPDGGVPGGIDLDNNGETGTEDAWTVRAAVSTTAFWVITCVYILSWIMLFFPFVHLPIKAIELGYDAAQGATLVMTMGAGGIVGRILFGWISDRIGRLPTLYVALTFEVLAFVMFAKSSSLVSLYIAAAIFIAGSSAATSLNPAIIADNFGRRYIGTITGISFAIAGSAAAVGPLLAGLIREATGTYEMAFQLGAGLNIAAILLLTILRRPSRRS